MNRQQRRAMTRNKEVAEFVIDERYNMLKKSLVSSMETLRDEFGFTSEQLDKFAEEHNKRLSKMLGVEVKENASN